MVLNINKNIISIMQNIKLIHTADTHIGYNQYKSEVRKKDFLDAFEQVIDYAIKVNADAVIHAGDLFDSRAPSLEDVLQTINIISKLKIKNIPFLGIVGNHERKQTVQWLDLFEEMGIATRLKSKPYKIRDVALYGIDSLSKSKIPLFDYSSFEEDVTAIKNILVMHQLMNPFPFGEWDVEEVIRLVPFKLDAVLLGDNHKHEIQKIEGAWVTYSGSTERNSASEMESRTFNIVNISNNEISIENIGIKTRDFKIIPVEVTEEKTAYKDIFDKINEHEIKGSVVFVKINGDPSIKISLNEIEEFVLKRGALISKIENCRTKDDEFRDIKISYLNPDDAIKKEIRNLNLTEDGILIDEIIRDFNIKKSNISKKIEEYLDKNMEKFNSLKEEANEIHEGQDSSKNLKEYTLGSVL